jgi:hypothetical protein
MRNPIAVDDIFRRSNFLSMAIHSVSWLLIFFQSFLFKNILASYSLPKMERGS